MSIQITTAFVQQYRANVEHLVQQKGSRLRALVRAETQAAEFEFYDRIGATTAQEVTGRHQDTPLINVPHDRRRVSLRDFDWADLIDRPDRIRMLIDPSSPYSQNAAYALGRKMDDVILDAAFGTVYTGKTGATTVTFPNTQQIAVDYVESGSATNSGLTIAKLRKAKEILDKNEVDPTERRYIAVTAKQVTDLLKTTEVSSADYNTVRALVQGELNTFMGFEFVRTELVRTNASNYRRVLVWAQSGLLLAVGQDIVTDIGPRRDKRNSTQVYVSASFGATRMEEEKVVEIICAE
jgi:arsenate reductase-like glutaredoxin family protein